MSNNNNLLYGPKWVTVLGCNLEEDIVREITGWSNYTERDTLMENGTRILRFLVEELSSNKYFFWTFFLSPEEQTSKAGKKVYINSNGQTSYYAFSPPEGFEGCRVAYRGEGDLTKMLQIYMNYTPSEFSSWEEELTNNGMSSVDLLEGNVQGLNRILMKWAEKGERVGAIFTERNNYQNIETHQDLIFAEDPSGEDPPAYIINRLQSYREPGAFVPIRGNIDLEQYLQIA